MRKLVVFLFLLAACASPEVDGPALTFADFTNPSTSPTVLDETQPATTVPATTLPPATPATTTTSTSTTSTTVPVAGPPAPLLLIDETGGSIWRSGQSDPVPLVEEALTALLDDRQGGFVLQRAGAGIDPAADQRVFWSRATNKDAQPFLAVFDGLLLRLWGVADMSGRPHMIITTTDGPSSATPGAVKLVAYDFEQGPRDLGVVNPAGGGPVAVSYGGGRYLLEQRHGANSFFEFRDESGEVLDLEYNPLTECVDDSTCPRSPVLAPAGGLVAYLQSSFDEQGSQRLSVVVYDVDLGTGVAEVDLPSGDITGLAFDGSTVIANRGPGAAAYVIDPGTGTVGTLTQPGEAQFLVTPPGFEGTFELVRK